MKIRIALGIEEKDDSIPAGYMQMSKWRRGSGYG